MNSKELKKILAGVGIAGLLGGLPMAGGTAFGGSGWGPGSSWGGSKGSAVSTPEKTEKVETAVGSDEKAAIDEKTGEDKGVVTPAEEGKKDEAAAGSGSK